MRPPRHLDIRTAGRNERGELVLNVRLRRRSFGAARILYRAFRGHGLDPLRSAWMTARVVAVAPEAPNE